jgi:RHS repeat-associated protein
VASEARPARDFDPYPKTWAGYLKHPGTGLYDAQARLYDPDSGLFLEPDPVRPEPDAPETWSRYGYALGDPVGGWDPDGRCAVDVSWKYGVRVECGHVLGFLRRDLAAIDRAAGQGLVDAAGELLDVALTVGGGLAYMAGLQTEATEARMARFVAGVQALGTALSHPLDTAGAMVTGVRRGLGRYLDDLANGREEAAARSAAKVIGTIELGIATGGLGAQALKAASAPLAGAARHIGRAVSTAAQQTRRALANVPTRVGEALRRPGRAAGSVEKAVDDVVGVGDLGGEVAAKGGTYRDSAGRLRNADGTYAFDGGPKSRTTGSTHGNTAGDQPATLYERYDAEGNFLKHGISQDPSRRYTQAELDGGYLIRTQTGPRREMLRIERELVETNPGPLNREPWAGRRKR